MAVKTFLQDHRITFSTPVLHFKVEHDLTSVFNCSVSIRCYSTVEPSFNKFPNIQQAYQLISFNGDISVQHKAYISTPKK